MKLADLAYVDATMIEPDIWREWKYLLAFLR